MLDFMFYKNKCVKERLKLEKEKLRLQELELKQREEELKRTLELATTKASTSGAGSAGSSPLKLSGQLKSDVNGELCAVDKDKEAACNNSSEFVRKQDLNA